MSKRQPTHTAKLDVCGFAYKVVCEDSKYSKPTVVYRDSDASNLFIQCLLTEQREIENILSRVEPMIIKDEYMGEIDNPYKCCLCGKGFTSYEKVYGNIVKHHNHVTGEFIGMAHNACILKCRQTKHINVIF